MDFFIAKQNKRRKVVLSALITYVLVFAYVELFNDLNHFLLQNLILAILLVIVGLLVWLAIDGTQNFKMFVATLYPPMLYVTTSLLFIGSVSIRAELLLSVLFAIGYYFLLLAINVLYVSSLKKIPLRQVGLSTLFFSGIIILTLLGIFISRLEWGINVGLLSWWFAIVLFGYSYIKHIKDTRFGIEIALYSLVTLELALLINFWPSNPTIAIVALSGWSFVFLGLIQHHLQKDLTRSITNEFVLISAILLLAYLIV